jgi:hypothetical protein
MKVVIPDLMSERRVSGIQASDSVKPKTLKIFFPCLPSRYVYALALRRGGGPPKAVEGPPAILSLP